jgi:MFS transporter, NNP family, nitrate/nitrite transporter
MDCKNDCEDDDYPGIPNNVIIISPSQSAVECADSQDRVPSMDNMHDDHHDEILSEKSDLSSSSSVGASTRFINPLQELMSRDFMAVSSQRKAERRRWNPIHQKSPYNSSSYGINDQDNAALSLVLSSGMKDSNDKTMENHAYEPTQFKPITPDEESEVEMNVSQTKIPSDDSNGITHPSAYSDDDESPIEDVASQVKGDLEANVECPSVVTEQNHIFTHVGAPDSKFERYDCFVDSTQEDKSMEIYLYSFQRPHMRAFHLAWMTFFVAFFAWFSITPLLADVQRSLQLSHKEIWTSSTLAVAGSAFTRILIGPLCEKYGARWSTAITLIACSIPTALTGLVQSARDLYVLRLFVGIAGSSFVTCQYWTSSMFATEVAGTANALVAGWGNLGGGITQIVMGSVLFPFSKLMYELFNGKSDTMQVESDHASDFAWRTICIFPAILCLVMSYVVLKYSDDSPKGNYIKRKRQGLMPEISTMKNLHLAASSINAWILFVQYGCCFGAEITMVNAFALYFQENFGLSTESAAAIASILGWMNLFARGLGGFLSDWCNSVYGFRGRLVVQWILLVLEGIFIIIFGYTSSLGSAIVVMIILSIFVQAAKGSTFGIVPYIDSPLTGSITGLVGAGGNVGGVIYSIVILENGYSRSFTVMGITVLMGSFLTLGLFIRDHGSLFFGEENVNILHRRMNHNESFGTVPPLSTGHPCIRDGTDGKLKNGDAPTIVKNNEPKAS